MTRTGPKEHLWSWLPELGDYGYYCGRCHRVQRNSDDKIISYQQALKELEQKGGENVYDNRV